MDSMQRELCNSSKHFFNMRQENLYYGSNFLTYKWYRKIYGGEWRLLKLGKDVPDIMLFCVWTKINRNDAGVDCWNGYYEVLETENYPETGVLTRWEVFKQFFKNIFGINR